MDFRFLPLLSCSLLFATLRDALFPVSTLIASVGSVSVVSLRADGILRFNTNDELKQQLS